MSVCVFCIIVPVHAEYATKVASSTPASASENLEATKPQTRDHSTIVGISVSTDVLKKVMIARIPLSAMLITPPVCRVTWNEESRLNRWWKILSAKNRDSCWLSGANTT